MCIRDSPTDAPSSSKGDGVAAQRANLFASLNKGTEVTKGTLVSTLLNRMSFLWHVGLRKVTDDMKTHKNPELRASSVVKASGKPAVKTTPKAVTTVVKKPPVCELQGKKWVVVSVCRLVCMLQCSFVYNEKFLQSLSLTGIPWWKQGAEYLRHLSQACCVRFPMHQLHTKGHWESQWHYPW